MAKIGQKNARRRRSTLNKKDQVPFPEMRLRYMMKFFEIFKRSGRLSTDTVGERKTRSGLKEETLWSSPLDEVTKKALKEAKGKLQPMVTA